MNVINMICMYVLLFFWLFSFPSAIYILHYINPYKEVCIRYLYMGKTHTTLTIDEDILRRAKQSGLNISMELEKVLQLKIIPTKRDLPEKALTIKCSLCSKEIEEGFVCRERQLVLCKECQSKFDMTSCPHDIEGQHEHLYFGENFPLKRPQVKRLAEELSK